MADASDIQRALRLLRNRQVSDAIAVLEHAIDVIPAHLMAHVLLARAYELRKAWQSALTAWEEARMLMPTSPLVQDGRQRVLRHLDRVARDAETREAAQHHAEIRADVLLESLDELDADPDSDVAHQVLMDLLSPPDSPSTRALPAATEALEDRDMLPASTRDTAEESHGEAGESDEADPAFMDAVLNDALDTALREEAASEPSGEPPDAPAAPSESPDAPDAADASSPPQDDEAPSPSSPSTAEDLLPDDVFLSSPSETNKAGTQPAERADDTDNPAPAPDDTAPDDTDNPTPDDTASIQDARQGGVQNELQEGTKDSAQEAIQDESAQDESAQDDVSPLPGSDTLQNLLDSLQDEAPSDAGTEAAGDRPAAEDGTDASESSAEDASTAGSGAALPESKEAGTDTASGSTASGLDWLRKQTEAEVHRTAQQNESPPRPAMSEPGDASDISDRTGDLDRLIEELESARMAPSPTPDDMSDEEADAFETDVDLEYNIEDLVSETLGRIYTAQGRYREAARIYVKLAAQEPENARKHLERASELRVKSDTIREARDKVRDPDAVRDDAARDDAVRDDE